MDFALDVWLRTGLGCLRIKKVRPAVCCQLQLYIYISPVIFGVSYLYVLQYQHPGLFDIRILIYHKTLTCPH